MNTDDLSLRPATPADLTAIAEVHLAARRGAGAAFPPSVHSDEEAHDWVASWDLSSYDVWVAADGGRIAGYARTTPTWLDDLYVRPEHQGAPGLAHGGILATALDDALGSLNWLLRTISVTGRLETDYRRPVPVGSVLHITAEVTAVAGRKIYARAVGRLDGPDGPVAVRADALFIEVKVDHFIENGRKAWTLTTRTAADGTPLAVAYWD